MALYSAFLSVSTDSGYVVLGAALCLVCFHLFDIQISKLLRISLTIHRYQPSYSLQPLLTTSSSTPSPPFQVQYIIGAHNSHIYFRNGAETRYTNGLNCTTSMATWSESRPTSSLTSALAPGVISTELVAALLLVVPLRCSRRNLFSQATISNSLPQPSP